MSKNISIEILRSRHSAVCLFAYVDKLLKLLFKLSKHLFTHTCKKEHFSTKYGSMPTVKVSLIIIVKISQMPAKQLNDSMRKTLRGSALLQSLKT
jgi:hypothetical protein